jgi:hypothetical protein
MSLSRPQRRASDVGAMFDLGAKRIYRLKELALGKVRGKWPAEYSDWILARAREEERVRQQTEARHKERERERENERKEREYQSALTYLLEKKIKADGYLVAAQAWLEEARRQGVAVWLEEDDSVMRYSPEEAPEALLRASRLCMPAIVRLLRARQGTPPRAPASRPDPFEEAAARGVML